MRRMGINGEMRLGEAVELYPQVLPFFKQLGMCCVNEDNEYMSVEALCRQFGVESCEFIDAVNELI